MAKRGIISRAVGTVKSVVQEAAATVIETPSAGKPSLADLGVPVPAPIQIRKTSRKKVSSRKVSKSESKSTRKVVRKKGKKRRR